MVKNMKNTKYSPVNSTGATNVYFSSLANTTEDAEKILGDNDNVVYPSTRYIFVKYSSNIIEVPSPKISKVINLSEPTEAASEGIITEEQQNRIIDKILETNLL
jgi:hypothetical protein